MKSERSLQVFFLIALAAYHILFWKEQLGLNTLLFSGLMIGFLFFLHREEGFSREAIVMAMGTLLSALLVVIHNSLISKFTHLLSFSCLVGFVQQKGLRFLWYGFLLGIFNIGEAPLKIIRRIKQSGGQNNNFYRSFQYIKIGFIPALVLFLFYILYYFANPKFAQFSDAFLSNFEWLFHWNISFSGFFFSLLSIIICATILFKTQVQYFLSRQQKKSETLKRQGRTKGLNLFPFSTIALKNEYNAALFLIYALNVLLLLVNLTDITYVWFGFDESSPQNLKTYVHEGTTLLIIAILLAMAVLLFFFRKNLNFFPNRKYLLLGAYIWIIQNALLAISVGIRNYRYIDFHGLAYKRIGVFLFLLLVFYGLWTMFQKVNLQKSLYFLLLKNTWAVYALLLFCSSINWDILITRYNLEVPTKGAVDVRFMLLHLSDKNLYLLKEHPQQIKNLDAYPKLQSDIIDQLIKTKESRFRRRTQKKGWPSWNLSDYRNSKYLLQSEEEK